MKILAIDLGKFKSVACLSDNLHALPGALGFYSKLRIGLLDSGPDPEEPDHLVYFETLRIDDPWPHRFLLSRNLHLTKLLAINA